MQNFEIEFNDGINPISCRQFSDHFSPHESQVIDIEIQKLLNIGVIKEVEHHPEEFISPIFVIPKKDGEYRMILNLKELNKSIPYHHFKMETFELALKLVKPNCFFGSVDIRHTYYSIPVSKESQLKLRFQKSGKVYSFCACPMGISCAPRIYTKLMKPVYASLRMLGHTNSGYIDDSLLEGDTADVLKILRIRPAS